MVTSRRTAWLAMTLSLATSAAPAAAQKRYDSGASDTEIKIGHFAAYSGPGSAWGLIGKTIDAYFSKVNSEGGVNGRRIRFISYDDAMIPAKAVEHARKLVEDDGVLLLFQTMGTASNLAIQKYMNDRKVPQLFVASPSSRFGDPRSFPWTMGFQPTCRAEGRALATWLREHHPGARVGILSQNDDYGRECVAGMREGLGARAGGMIVSEQTYELSDPTIDSQLVNLKAAGVNVLYDVSSPKHTIQAIRRVHELGWRVLHLVSSVSSSIGSVLKPAGLEASRGIVAAGFGKNPDDPTWKEDPGMIAWRAFMDRHFPKRDRSAPDVFTVFGYTVAQVMVEVLRRCGDDLTRENVMRQATSLRDVELPLLLPGIRVNTASDDYFPLEQFRLQRFNGEVYEPLGPVIDAGARR
jgi:branched-chain amino acid transport system substrate-binding protein